MPERWWCSACRAYSSGSYCRRRADSSRNSNPWGPWVSPAKAQRREASQPRKAPDARRHSPTRRRASWQSDALLSDLEVAEACGADLEHKLAELSRIAEIQSGKLHRTKEEISRFEGLLAENKVLVQDLKAKEEEQRAAQSVQGKKSWRWGTAWGVLPVS